MKENIIIKARIRETDKYRHKAMLKAVNEQYRCPKDNAFLVWENRKKGIISCPKCGFQKKLNIIFESV